MTDYFVLKLFHLGALILWLGPAFGAWLVTLAVQSSPENNTRLLVYQRFYLIVALEHLAFLVLLVTGFLMALRYQMFSVGWLTEKLVLVFLVVVPLEILDLVLGNWLAPRAEGKLYAGHSLTVLERFGYRIYHGLFTKVSLVLIPVTVVLIMYLAISKAAFISI